LPVVEELIADEITDIFMLQAHWLTHLT